ncbi:MAG TPA: hypothetical protein VEF89_05725 [Solirubrobacteraceae bacterium]|nr:hypothetical protein [Solirubrobacteraceae bacterium]
MVFGVLLAAAVLAGAKLAAFLGVSPFLAAVLGGCVCALVVVVRTANAETPSRGNQYAPAFQGPMAWRGEACRRCSSTGRRGAGRTWTSGSCGSR